MRWLNISKPACTLHCAYCGLHGAFPHAKSFQHQGDVLSLHSCTRCGSLIYDLAGIDAPLVSNSDQMSPEAARAARYVLESGFSSRYVAMCGLSCLPDVPDQDLSRYLFVDVGAGMGIASHFMRTVFGVPTLTIEPSFTGRLAQQVLGLTVHRAYFEDLPPAVMAEIAAKPCLLHLNSVVEHLDNPAALLRDIIARARVEQLAIIVPDGGALDYDGPFAAALPFLAPRDHRHLPTRLGLEYLLKDLGFAYQSIRADACLLIAIGARAPIATPSDRMVHLADMLLLENLMRHPHPQVREGGAARLLPFAVTTGNAPLLAEVRRILAYADSTANLLSRLRARAWDDIPYHLGPTCYWLAVATFAEGRAQQAQELLDVTIDFADAIAEDAPERALTPLEFKWAALIYRAHICRSAGREADARLALRLVLASRADPQNGARSAYLDQAEQALGETEKDASPRKTAPLHA